MPHTIDAIILFSHGSLLCGAGENLRQLAVRMQIRGDAPIVEVGYLNYSEPSFEQTVAFCVERSAVYIVVVPFFLVAGKFVTVDLPPRVAAAQARYPQLNIKIADAICFHESLADAVLACTERAVAPCEWRRMLNNARQSCRQNPACPLYKDNCGCMAAEGHEQALP